MEYLQYIGNRNFILRLHLLDRNKYVFVCHSSIFNLSLWAASIFRDIFMTPWFFLSVSLVGKSSLESENHSPQHSIRNTLLHMFQLVMSCEFESLPISVSASSVEYLFALNKYFFFLFVFTR